MTLVVVACAAPTVNDVTTTEDAATNAVVITTTTVAPTLAGFTTSRLGVGERELTVAVADTAALRRQGLRGVIALPEGLDGMVFVFEETRTATFVMQETLIPLDIWWFDESGRLLGSTEMEPCESVCPGYESPGEIAWALETPRGEIEFSPGDVLVPPSL